MLKTIVKTFKEVYKIIPVYTVMLFLISIIAALVSSGSTYVSSLVFDNAYKVFSGDTAKEVFYELILLYLGMYLLELIINIISEFIVVYGFNQVGTNYFGIRMGEHTSKFGIIELENPEILNLIERARRTISGQKITNLLLNCSSITRGIFSLFGISFVLATFNLWLIPIAIISCIPTMIMKIIRGNQFYELQRRQVPKARSLNYFWSLFLSPVHIKEMRVLGFSDYLSDKWEKTNSEVNEETWAFQKKDAAIMFLFDLFRIFCYILGVVLSILFVVKGMITIGQFGACITAFLSLQGNTFRVARMMSAFTGNLYYVDDYFEFLKVHPDVWGRNKFEGVKNKIKLVNINFQYPNTNKCALENINLTIRKGEKIALVGENGSGKTTLSKILLGLYPPNSGNLQFDYNDVKAFEIQSFYKRFSMVSQNFVKYCLKLRENVALGDLSQVGNDNKIISVLERAEIEETLEKTNGLDGMLGREFGGAELSGGQWQKLAIARGLFKDYDFIVLDEPTSALDPIVETQIFKKFLEAMDNKTALIISHRVGLCRLADRIVVMQNGKIIEEGTHNELMEKKGYYYELFTSQQMWYV